MSDPNLITIVAAVVDVRYLQLYKLDGTIYSIPQGDPRVQRILDVAMPALKKEGDTVVVSIAEENHYANFEEKTGGLVKLFRVAKAKVAEFFGKTEAKPAAPITLGIIPTAKDVPAMTAVVQKRAVIDPVTGKPVDKQVAAVAEIMKHAVPVTDKAYAELPKAVDEKAEEAIEDTLIAVIDNNVVPGVESLKPQFASASVAGNSTVGMVRFLERCAKVMGKRRHSVEDLLKFMKRGDLPIADDGSIVIYKILKRREQDSKTFYDCHTNNVPQKVGSFVHMDENMVDPNRRNECSNGLHVARRQYLGNFSGDVCVLAKVNPEDVIAVPDYDANKMRVCGYHILAELSDEAFAKLKSNRAMTDSNETQLLLGKVLSGDHIGILEYVKINGQKGKDVVITPADGVQPAPEKAPVRKAEALPEDGNVAPVVDVKALAEKVVEAKEADKAEAVHLHEDLPAVPLSETLYKAPPAGMDVKSEPIGEATPPPAPVQDNAAKAGIDVATKADVGIGKLPAEAKPVKKASLKERAESYYRHIMTAGIDGKAKAAAELVKLKKDSKSSWTKLGLDDEKGASILRIAQDALPQKGAIFTNEATIAKAEKKAERKPTNERLSSTGAGPFPTPRPREQLAELLKKPPTKELANQIVAIKKKAKKSWDALGVTPSEVNVILELASK